MTSKIDLVVNRARRILEVDPDRTLLSVLREDLELTGTRYGCGEGQCGACTVQMGGIATRSCVLKVGSVKGPVTTVEGLAANGKLHKLQQAFLDECAFQCGYCTSGMLMSAASLLARKRAPSDDDILQAMQGNICRCGMFRRIGRAIRRASQESARRS